MKAPRFVLCAVLFFVVCLPALADTHYVSLDGHHTDPFTNWYMAATNINDALTAAANGDTVVVSNGTYYPSAAITVSMKSLVVTSLYGAAQTIFDGGGQSICGLNIYVETNTAVYGLTISNFAARGANVGGTKLVTLADCVIVNNRSTGSGGGIYVNAILNISNCVIRGNVSTTAGTYAGGGVYMAGGVCRVDKTLITCNSGASSGNTYGGGISSSGGTLTMENCTIASNSCSIAGGLYLLGAGSRVANSTIVSNVALGAANVGLGGGIYLNSGLIDNCFVGYNSSLNWRGGGIYFGGGMISNCTIANNTTVYGGAGVYVNGAVRLANSTIVSNVCSCSFDVTYGAGVRLINAGSVMENCLVAWNSNATSRGGGVWMDAGTIRNCTVVSNYAAQCGGVGGVGGSINSIVYFNRDSSAFPNWFWGQPTLSGFFTNCCTTPDPAGYLKGGVPQGVNCITNDPNMVNMPANCRLLKGSPCINAGTNESWMDTAVDLDGRPRIREGTVDMGVYEWFPKGTVIKL